MQLSELIAGLDLTVPPTLTAPLQIGGITADSRRVKPGDLFAALPGSRADGRQFINQAVAAGGVDHLAMEASSHGLDQYRLDGVVLSAAGFTNLTRDHLDYHTTMEAYFAAKVRLFERILPRQSCAVLNADSGAYPFLEAVCRRRDQRVISFGTGAADLALRDRRPSATGQDLTLSVFGATELLHLPLAGEFQALNALCALGLVIGSGAEPRSALAQLERLEGVRGRLELAASTPAGAPIYVDYAHTPDALETVLEALRPHVDGRLVVVFGCGGDRDPGKRPLMGAVAERLAGHVILTSDNPRTEDPERILDGIESGMRHRAHERIEDRRAAIARALAIADRERDIVLLAGKGHETCQIRGTDRLPFDEAAIVHALLAEPHS